MRRNLYKAKQGKKIKYWYSNLHYSCKLWTSWNYDKFLFYFLYFLVIWYKTKELRKIRNILLYVLNPQNLRNKNITENNAPISDFTCRVCYNNPPVYIESVAVPHTAGRWQHKYRRVIINAVIWCKFCNCAGNQGREVEEIQSLDFSMTSWCFIYKYNQWGGQTPVGF